MKGKRLLIPVSMRLVVLNKLHEGRRGITKCREIAKTSVWWPGLGKQLEELLNNFSTCIKEHANTPEPVIPSELPDRSWQKPAADLFELKRQTFLLVIDYFSRYVLVAKLAHTTSPVIVVHRTNLCQITVHSSRQMHLPSSPKSTPLLTSRPARGIPKRMVKWNAYSKL